MNKSQLVQSLAKDVRISKSLAEKSINAIFSTIKTGLKKDKAVQLIGFGTFRVVNRKA
ncbi:MAG TPA: HU family DNA-binding protein, partial [bacterium]|nr:HU family DNA-binding protein [bacterium]